MKLGDKVKINEKITHRYSNYWAGEEYEVTRIVNEDLVVITQTPAPFVAFFVSVKYIE